MKPTLQEAHTPFTAAGMCLGGRCSRCRAWAGAAADAVPGQGAAADAVPELGQQTHTPWHLEFIRKCIRHRKCKHAHASREKAPVGASPLACRWHAVAARALSMSDAWFSLEARGTPMSRCRRQPQCDPRFAAVGDEAAAALPAAREARKHEGGGFVRSGAHRQFVLVGCTLAALMWRSPGCCKVWAHDGAGMEQGIMCDRVAEGRRHAFAETGNVFR
eukprot:351613-Chlamydomonas_euryale.AAC.4